MKTARAAFGCCLNRKYQKIYVVGGAAGQDIPTNKCEQYDVNKDEWTDLPSLDQGLCSASIITVGEQENIQGPKYLFCMGGISKSEG